MVFNPHLNPPLKPNKKTQIMTIRNHYKSLWVENHLGFELDLHVTDTDDELRIAIFPCEIKKQPSPDDFVMPILHRPPPNLKGSLERTKKKIDELTNP